MPDNHVCLCGNVWAASIHVVTTTPASSAGHKALKYAEETLCVNSSYEDLLSVRNKLDEQMTRAAELRDERRQLESLIEEREIEIATDYHAAHPDSSVAATDRSLKLKIPKDGRIRDLRTLLSEAISNIEGVEYDIKMSEHDIRIGVARLTELGGYLNYLAVVKQAQLEGAKKPETPTTPEKPENIE